MIKVISISRVFSSLFLFLFLHTAIQIQARIQQLPEPPQLIDPKNGSTVSETKPVFYWTAALKLEGRAVIYELTIVPVLKGQDPKGAFSANKPHHQITTRRTFHQYDGVPFHDAWEYAWRVRAIDQNGMPIAGNDGYTDIFRFTYTVPVDPSQPLRITTEPLTMTGYRPQPVHITTEPLTMTGYRPQPVHITTEPLTMTGYRPQPVHITTEPLTMTGYRPQPVHITTEPLTMTGYRPQPIQITTDVLTMTGYRESEPSGDKESFITEWRDRLDTIRKSLEVLAAELQAKKEDAVRARLEELAAEAQALVDEAEEARNAELEQKAENIQRFMDALKDRFDNAKIGEEVVTIDETPNIDKTKFFEALQERVNGLKTRLEEALIELQQRRIEEIQKQLDEISKQLQEARQAGATARADELEKQAEDLQRQLADEKKRLEEIQPVGTNKIRVIE